MVASNWHKSIDSLKNEISSQQFNTWIRPLQVEANSAINNSTLTVVAPNRFIRDWVKDKFLGRIRELFDDLNDASVEIVFEVVPYGGETSNSLKSAANPSPSANFAVTRESREPQEPREYNSNHYAASHQTPEPLGLSADISADSRESNSKGSTQNRNTRANVDLSEIDIDRPALSISTNTFTGRGNDQSSNSELIRPAPTLLQPNAAPSQFIIPSRSGYPTSKDVIVEGKLRHKGALNQESTFDNFIEGKSNQLARAAAMQVAENPGYAYNPLFIYGGVGLGKTHLMHAIGNTLVQKKPGAKVVYLHSETFVATMVTALQLNAISEFKRFYRSVDALLIDDIQFFAGKERSQEEFFHTFNALLEGGQQIILTCDRFHKEINGLEERLKSRFGWGLTVAVEPPELETRAAILIKKAALSNVALSNDSAMFIAQRLRSNVRELEGALKRVIAHANFVGQEICPDLVKEALKDLFAVQDKQVTIDNIQRSVAEYYRIKMGDMMSKRRNRSVARPRQVAMTLSKELTNHSLPEIGDAFGGRDHTTVLHACRQVNKLRHSSSDIQEDYNNLLRALSM